MPFSPLTSLFSSRSTKDGLVLSTLGLEAYRARAELASMSLESELQKKTLQTCLHVFQSKDALFPVDSLSMSDRMQDERERTIY